MGTGLSLYLAFTLHAEAHIRYSLFTFNITLSYNKTVYLCCDKHLIQQQPLLLHLSW